MIRPPMIDFEALAELHVSWLDEPGWPLEPDFPAAEYAVRLIRGTREPDLAGATLTAPERRPAAGVVAVGASPRATLFLVRAARARALLDGRAYTTPHDVKRVAPDVLRHRVILTYEAEAEGRTPEDVLDRILLGVLVP